MNDTNTSLCVWDCGQPAVSNDQCASPADECLALAARNGTQFSESMEKLRREPVLPHRCHAGCEHDPGIGHSTSGYAANH